MPQVVFMNAGDGVTMDAIGEVGGGKRRDLDRIDGREGLKIWDFSI